MEFDQTKRILEHIHDAHVAEMMPLISPKEIKHALPMSECAQETVMKGRREVVRILSGEDKRMLAVVGPCSIHDVDAALDYAQRLHQAHVEYGQRLFIVMRTYFEKPRTTTGWKGLVNDPDLDGSYNLEKGLTIARRLLLDIAGMGLPVASEVLDPIVPQYIADLITWASIGARTTESQTHREMASGLSMPIGFKNSTDGNLQVAVNALLSARQSHHFLGIDQDGQTCVITTLGNPWGHIILRGGGGSPNCDRVSVALAEEQLCAVGLEPRIMIDCSHDNSTRRYELQEKVLRDLIFQRAEGTNSLIGMMLESNLEPGNQAIPADKSQLTYGVSITDPCMGWDMTDACLKYAYEHLATP
ncbi:MAG: 3-deoxy-7-phosphoheptulonate synthase [Candidatus Hydrogenedentales bacterium]|jgi:3-deoxy-7-phosphoheptulonate synthase